MTYEELVAEATDRMRLRREHPELVMVSDGANVARALREQTREIAKAMKTMSKEIASVLYLLNAPEATKQKEEV